jgi:hypothetical protein
MAKIAFSSRLQDWLESDQPKTIKNLVDVFAEKSFAIIILVLMFLPALPIPTGGVTHIFELIVMLLAIELMLGRRSVWLPKKWLNLKLGKKLEKKTIPIIIRRIRWFEKYSRPRYGWLINHRQILRLVGLIFFVLAVAAFVAPPFAGLDTLPSLGAVIIALALILDDALLFIVGLLMGSIGAGIIVATGGITLNIIKNIFEN